MPARSFQMKYIEEKNNEFNLAIGRATARWSHIEAGLCQWFERITKMKHPMARSVFYSVSGFDGRRRMLQGALSCVSMSDQLRVYLKLLSSKAQNYSGSRNKMAHGDPLFIDLAKSKHHGTLIILEGAETWKADPPDEAILTLSNLELMTENFRYLGALIADSLNWEGDKARHPSRWTEQVHALPKRAHDQKLDPSTAKKFQSGLPAVLDFGR